MSRCSSFAQSLPTEKSVHIKTQLDYVDVDLRRYLHNDIGIVETMSELIRMCSQSRPHNLYQSASTYFLDSTCGEQGWKETDFE
jgi:hypothetical protein